MIKLDYYKLMRNFWDFAFENPELIRPTHCALFSFAVEHCNRLGWKQKFGLPASMVLDAIGIKSYSVYKKTFDDLVGFGFIEVIEYSKNQHSSNIIALKENYKAHYKANDKAVVKHITKQVSKHITTQGEYSNTTSSIIQDTKIQISNNTGKDEKEFADAKNISFADDLKNNSMQWIETVAMKEKISPDKIQKKLDEFVVFLRTKQKIHNNKKEFIDHFTNWLPKNLNDGKSHKLEPQFQKN